MLCECHASKKCRLQELCCLNGHYLIYLANGAFIEGWYLFDVTVKKRKIRYYTIYLFTYMSVYILFCTKLLSLLVRIYEKFFNLSFYSNRPVVISATLYCCNHFVDDVIP